MTEPLILRAADLVAERPEGTADDIHFTEALAASVIGYASLPGELVLDPFAGYGTTVTVAERMGRRAIGIELVPEHLEIARRRTGGGAKLILGDARELSRLVDEPVDLVLTSPPYMPSTDHPQNPLTGYATDDGDYAVYLGELGSIFGQVGSLLRPGGRLVVNVGERRRHRRQRDAAGERHGNRHRPARAAARRDDLAVGRAATGPGRRLPALVRAPGRVIRFDEQGRIATS